jgi:hypothetical protein
VTANHVVADGTTKMIGAKHGLGRLTVVWIIESPVVVAGKGSVVTFAVAAAPSTMVRQLTMARNEAMGFVPRRFSGTGALSSRTNP